MNEFGQGSTVNSTQMLEGSCGHNREHYKFITVFILTDEQRLYMLSYSFQIISLFMHHHDYVLAYAMDVLQSQDCLVLVRALLAYFQTL